MTGTNQVLVDHPEKTCLTALLTLHSRPPGQSDYFTYHFTPRVCQGLLQQSHNARFVPAGTTMLDSVSGRVRVAVTSYVMPEPVTEMSTW